MFTTSNEYIWSQKILIFMHGLKSSILAIFLKGWNYQLKNSDFCKLLLVQFSKFKNFLCICWFLGKNVSNFIYPVWKLHNLYCHTEHILFPHEYQIIVAYQKTVTLKRNLKLINIALLNNKKRLVIKGLSSLEKVRF